MKKILMCMLAATVILTSACTKKNDDITGDVKDKNSVVNVDESDDEQKVVEVQDNKEPDQTEENGDVTQMPDEVQESNGIIEELIMSLGGHASSGGEYHNDMITFVEAVKNANGEAIAKLTMGKSEYYDFLKDVKIEGYDIYPFELTDEKKDEYALKDIYLYSSDLYFIVFNVVESTSEMFTEGENVFYIELDINPISGSVVSKFIPVDNMEWRFRSSRYYAVTDQFVKQFLAHYMPRLEEGKNYPDTFDFSSDVHLITHLMANSGVYAAYPPYSLDEINKFITESFDGNAGIELKSSRDFENWLFYAPDEENPEKMYGCSYAHGGMSVESALMSRVEDGNMVTYNMRVYADYSNFAYCKDITLVFDEEPGKLPRLTLVNVINDTGRKAAVNSI